MLTPLKEQRGLEEKCLSDNREPKYSALTLKLSLAPKAFDRVKTILTRLRGKTGIPLAYVIRHKLQVEDEGVNSAFGVRNTIYDSIDQERIPCAPTLTNKAKFDHSDDKLESNGPFVPTFLTDSKAWAILHTLLSTAGRWQHTKKSTFVQNGCKVWDMLDNHFFSGNKVSIMCSDILSTLKALHCSSYHKNFIIDNYCRADVEHHNCHAALAEYKVTPLDENMKIHYFQDGIKDSSLNSVESRILADPQTSGILTPQ
jgi:hypothetical protein